MFNFTKTQIQRLSPPKKSIAYYKDSNEKGLGLYITPKKVITFYLRKRINGRDERVIIGNFPDISIENARKKARVIKGQIAEGINPNEEKRGLNREITFGELFKEFMERYSKKYKRTWKSDEYDIKRFVPHWFNRKISTITKREIQLLHDRIGDNNGPYQANRMIIRIRAIYNKAREWGWCGSNPTIGIKKFKERKRERFIKPDELPRFFIALENEPSDTAKDYVWLSLLTGARKNNVLAMSWSEIDWQLKEWSIPRTKNDEPVTIPLVEKAIDILTARKIKVESEWVFPSETSKTGHFAEPKRAWKRILNRASIENLRIHDIRRTMGSYQAITGASLAIIGKSLGHKSPRSTAIYARLNNDPVRAAMEKATAEMLSSINSKK